MEDWLKLLPALLGRLGILGLIVLLFSAGTILAESWGVLLPSLVREWSRAGLILGVVLVALAAILKIGQGLQWCARKLRAGHAETSEARRDSQDALANLGTLTTEEFDYLYTLLSSGQTRFHVGMVTPAPALMGKKILIWKMEISAFEWICELNPAIEKQRNEILHGMEAVCKKRLA
jgi:hypothetical protein